MTQTNAEPGGMAPRPPNRARLALLVWMAIFPLLTLLLVILNPLLGDAPLPVRTGIATAILVPIVVMWIIPFITKRFGGWLSGGGR